MKAIEVVELIKVGFERPKWYKRSVWNKAVKVMEYLSDNTNGEIVRTNSGGGDVKYVATVEVTNDKLMEWAVSYKRSLGFPLSVVETLPELTRIAEDLGVRVNNGAVLIEYRRRHPELAK